MNEQKLNSLRETIKESERILHELSWAKGQLEAWSTFPIDEIGVIEITFKDDVKIKQYMANGQFISAETIKEASIEGFKKMVEEIQLTYDSL